jgi:hypothetical protein
LEIVRKNRIRRLVSELNKQRRLQSRKIDILCNDFVSSHKNFLKQLQTMNLQIELYESLIGETNIDHVLDAAASAIQNLTGGLNTAIWLNSGFETHLYDEESFTAEQTDLVESCFTNSIAERIYNSRRCVELDELFEIGLPESQILSKLSAAAIPFCDSPGFVFVYREAASPISKAQLSDIALLIPGISKAVKACQKMPQAIVK